MISRRVLKKYTTAPNHSIRTLMAAHRASLPGRIKRAWRECNWRGHSGDSRKWMIDRIDPCREEL
jgi:hypothetical protein